MKQDLDPYWTITNAGTSFEKLPTDHFIRQLIEQIIPSNDRGQALEIGCYPGSFLALFGDLGYILNGIDTYPGVATMPANLQQLGYATGSFLQYDFEKWKPSEKFDIVSSFGFIEHFENYDSVIQKHILLLKENGWFVAGAPNFRYGIQYWFHFLFDKPNLRRHVLQAMDPLAWKKKLEENHIEVLYCGYCGGLELWMNQDQHPIQRWGGRVFMKLVSVSRKFFHRLQPATINNKRMSCYFLVIGRRKAPST